jgi:hypothetical protein
VDLAIRCEPLRPTDYTTNGVKRNVQIEFHLNRLPLDLFYPKALQVASWLAIAPDLSVLGP